MTTKIPASLERGLEWREALRKSMKAKERTDIARVPMNELDPEYRSHNREEVNLGLTMEQAMTEAKRCLDCIEPTCMKGFEIDIPDLSKTLNALSLGSKVLKRTSALPAVCGRMSSGKTMRRAVLL